MDDNRDYIHLNELEKLTLLTKEQVFDAVESGVFRLHANIDCPDAAAVDSHNVLLYSLHVRGFIELTQKQSLQVLVGKCQLTRFKAVPTLAYAKPRLINQAFPNAVKGQFNGIHEQRLSSKNIAFIVPKLVALYPEQESMMQIAKGKTSQGQVSSLVGLLSAFTEIISESSKQLSPLPIGLKASDIRLCPKSLSQSFNRTWQDLSRSDNRLSNQAKPVTNSAENQVGQGLKPNIETNPVKMIQHRILTLYPQAKAREVWNLIREDVREERYQFDVDVIIDGIDNERLYTSKDTADGMSFKRFQNMLSEVRKGIRE
ncbi:hypothetical protein APQ14_06875 [Vibrio toranzoniae]|uniref:Uncharacterized protein n=1 Tax=Vibrio toranzoniae TaxID=1194427 RepID=A0A109D9L7_9VIBR|nr:hypothetical protein [Vibrio toranzoniae]KWU01424.1 hypothetical protein APQ14_06875 [Vibrio toranzoniae]SBS38291.1 hypothetical protein VTO7225_02996 [Vibrio toranzoniae]